MNFEIAKELEGLTDFLIVRKSYQNSEDGLFLYKLSSTSIESTVDIPTGGHKFALLPYNQIATRGYECINDDAEAIVFDVHEKKRLPGVDEWVVDSGIIATDLNFDDQDQEYSSLVESVIDNEIRKGECSNVVISRIASASTEIGRLPFATAFLKRLLTQEVGAYWTFLLFSKNFALVGASPEVHVKRENGIASMVAISGTERIEHSVTDALENLSQSKKDGYELLIVLDEEIKMLSEIGNGRPKISGPHWRVMSNLIHSEFKISVECTADFRDVIRKTLFAPTVVGGPLKNAAAVISRNERAPRGYYSGALVEIESRDTEVYIDSCILIRTLFLDETNLLSVRVGSTITAKSSGQVETDESKIKLRAIRTALSTDSIPEPRAISQEVLNEYDGTGSIRPVTARKWYELDSSICESDMIFKNLGDKRINIVDYEDRFTHMWAKLLGSHGVVPTITNWIDFDLNTVDKSKDIVIFGPGPGNPLDSRDERIAAAYGHIDSASTIGIPMIAVCLSHQLFCRHLGFKIRQRETPNQGIQRNINWNARTELVGFYNSFEAVASNYLDSKFKVISSHDGGIDAVLTNSAVSIQFHAESVLSVNGDRIIAEMFSHLINI